MYLPSPFERKAKAMAKKVTMTQTTEHTRQFVKCFEKLRYNHNAFAVYSDFLALSAISISNSVNPHEGREQEYQRIAKNYTDKEQTLFSEMFACIAAEMEPAKGKLPDYHDVLGELFHNLNLQDEWKGQFFTPQNVSTMMELMTVGDCEEVIKKRGYIKMLEPCIGGGSTVIGAVNAMFQLGYNPCKQLFVVGYDLDERCVHMSYIQLSLMGIPAMIQRADSLNCETYGDIWYTPAFVLDDWAGRLRLERLAGIMLDLLTDNLPADNEPVADTEKEKPTAKKATAKFEQLTLF